MAEKIIVTSQCETCKYGTIDFDDKPKMPVWCSYKERYYVYGQRIPCGYYEKDQEKIK